MPTLYWWAFILWMRLTCRLFDLHRWKTTASHGYLRTFCGRCWAYTLVEYLR